MPLPRGYPDLCPYYSVKILTSIRVSNRQKKVSIDIPKLPDFIHKVYIACARKVYENVYLFEANIAPLQQQKNMRECEIICRESIIGVIRSSMPIEQILRAYIDEVEEEEVIEELIEKPASTAPAPRPTGATDISDNVVNKESNVKLKKSDSQVDTEKSEQIVKGEEALDSSPVTRASVPTAVLAEESLALPPAPVSKAESSIEATQPEVPLVGKPFPSGLEKASGVKVDTEPIKSPSLPRAPVTKLSFSDKDRIIKYVETDKVTKIKADDSEEKLAPKTLQRLEAISKARHEERGQELEEDNFENEEQLTIHMDGPAVKLGALDIQVLDDNLHLKDKPLLTGVETLP